MRYPFVTVLFSLIPALTLLLAIPAHAEEDPGQATELAWDELIPADWDPNKLFEDLNRSNQLDELIDGSPEAADLMAEMNRIMDNAPVVEELNGKMVKLPGFVVPIEFDGEDVTGFLLVPYFGACIHVPPPPPNQIVYVKSKEKLAIDGLFDAVWVTGKLTTARTGNELAAAGYTLDAYKVAPYE